MANSMLKNLAAVQPGTSGIIGHLTWMSISELLISRDELRDKLKKNGLEGFMPAPIRLPDAFRRATNAKYRHILNSGLYENYLFREVASDTKTVQRNIIRETVDQKGRRLDYDGNAAVLILDKQSEKVNISATCPVAERLAIDAATKFDIYKEHYGAQTVRSVLTAILKSMAPTPVRPSGGVYFVPAKYQDQLSAMVAFAKSLERGEGQMVPMIDTSDMRSMVTQKLVDHLRQTLRACEESADRQLTKSQLKELLENAKSVANDFTQYREIVTGDLAEMESLVSAIRTKVSEALMNLAV
jgi:hypothetical protein